MRNIFKNKSVLVLLGLIGLYILCRSIYFSENLNFSTEQGAFAQKSFELWQEKKIELVGPAISFRNNGRMIFQGSITYYFQLLFLLPGKYDPIISSYLFMLFGAAMMIPLYFGVKNLSDEKKAVTVCAVYTFLPLYVDYSRFFWNPNYQFVITPLVIWLASMYIKKRNRWWLLGESVLLGIQLLFHYQYLVVIGIFFVFHLLKRKFGFKEWAIFVVGIILGFSPMIIFELRHNFYNIRTLGMFLGEDSSVFGNGGGITQRHYFLSIGLSLLALFTTIKKIRLIWLWVYAITIGLFVVCLNKTLIKPSHGFGMALNWNYPMELKTNNIIKSNVIEGYNIVNQIYDTKASVQKYLLKIEGENIDEENYSTNRYLYIITDKIEPLSDPAYEANRFIPSTFKQKWDINSQYRLYLYERN